MPREKKKAPEASSEPEQKVEQQEKADTLVPVQEVDPRELARQRSREDLQRKRRNLRGGKGGF